MGTPQVNLVPAFEQPEMVVAESELPRDFHFAVTWVTLFAHLDLIQSMGPRTASPEPHPQPVPVLDLVPVVAAPLVEPAPRDPGAGWEMVVPKMIRTGPGQFTPVDRPERDG